MDNEIEMLEENIKIVRQNIQSEKEKFRLENKKIIKNVKIFKTTNLFGGDGWDKFVDNLYLYSKPSKTEIKNNLSLLDNLTEALKTKRQILSSMYNTDRWPSFYEY
jgi:hypothetical protein